MWPSASIARVLVFRYWARLQAGEGLLLHALLTQRVGHFQKSHQAYQPSLSPANRGSFERSTADTNISEKTES
jgi:hypothetical protein